MEAPQVTLRSLLPAALLLAGSLACATELALVTVSAQTVSGQSTTPPEHPQAASTYDHRFGPNPYLPSLATSDFEGFLKPADIPTAAYCEHCHTAVHAQWRQSAHANSFRAPWYLKNIQDLSTQKSVAATRHCEGCHNPAALFTGALTDGSTVKRPNDNDGVTCMVCHSIRSVSSTSGIGSYVLGRPAVLVDASGEAVPGIPADAEILAHLDRHKLAVMRPLYKTSEYCAACHKAALPEMLNGYKWLRTFSTYDEWQQSSWSTETPLPFYKKAASSTCQTCHMPSTPGQDPAAHAGQVASHRWLGANTAVPAQYGFDDQARRVVEYLRDDKLEIDIFALTLDHAQPTTSKEASATYDARTLVAPLGSRAFDVVPGDWVRVDVVVRNKGIGHTLVPELRDFYESWLDFEAKDDRGHVVYRSGAVGPDHTVDPEARQYTQRIVSRDGRDLTHHEVWKTVVRAYDATISPGRSDVVRYRFRIPFEAKGMTISASVRYRRFRRAFTDYVFGDKPSDPDRFPTVTMASAGFHIAVGTNLPAVDQKRAPDQTDLLRWNNYGIGMLDRLQFAEARDAFSHVVALDPKYEPGYVNVAIAEYSRGRYPQALEWLDRAQKLDASDGRAAFYRGLTLRWQNKYDDAIAALRPVADQWPRFRQVHQELGYIYLVQRRFEDAKQQYLAVLAIDPDDPLAHRWLGPVYDALGDHASAVREANFAAATGIDTSAGWVAQRFWREHLDVASEAMPGHTHSAGNALDDADVRRVLQLQNPPSYIWVEHF